MSNNHFQSRTTTEILLAFYVSCGFLFVILASLARNYSLIDMVKKDIFTLIGYLIYAIMTGIITYLFRKKIYNFKRSFLRDSNMISKGDLLTIIYTGLLVLLGLIAFLSIHASINFIYVIVLIIMVTVVGLNTYFGSFWQATVFDSNSNLDALKLEHSEWSTIYNSVMISLIIFVGGIIFTYFASNSQRMFDGVVIAYNVLGTPIIWLLRPVHVTMARIRKKIIEIQIDTITH